MFEVLPAGLDTFWLHSVFEKALGGQATRTITVSLHRGKHPTLRVCLQVQFVHRSNKVSLGTQLTLSPILKK